MYKQIGFQFDTLGKTEYESLYYTILAIEDFYRVNLEDHNISEASGKRKTARMRVLPHLPQDLQISIWFLYQNRFRKCLVKDVSTTGAGVILPFDDRHDLFNMDRPFFALINFEDTRDGQLNDIKAIKIQSVIRYCRPLEDPLPETLKGTLVSLNQEIHPIDAAMLLPKRRRRA